MRRLLQILGVAVVLSPGFAGWAGDAAPPPKTELPPGGDARARIEKALARLAHEPSLRELERAALRLADADVEGADGWMGSANWSAVLPVVKVTAEHDLERDESLDRYQDEPDRAGKPK